jgi:hypothetical protein
MPSFRRKGILTEWTVPMPYEMYQHLISIKHIPCSPEWMNLFEELERLTLELREYIFKAVVSANEMRFSLFERECQHCRNEGIFLWRIL